MNERAPLPESLERPSRGRVVVFAPHADDDVIGCGGTLAHHVALGDPVHVVVAFDGRRGDPDERYDAEEYVRLRRAEALAAGAHLGVTSYEFWDYPEGHEPAPPELLAATERVLGCVAEHRPEIVYAPWIGEHHLDHHTLARGVRLGLARAEFAGEAWGYEVWTPLVATRIVDVTGQHPKKLAALREHRTQAAEIAGLEEKALACSRQRAMYLGTAATHGEAFAPLGEPSADDARLLSGHDV